MSEIREICEWSGRTVKQKMKGRYSFTIDSFMDLINYNCDHPRNLTIWSPTFTVGKRNFQFMVYPKGCFLRDPEETYVWLHLHQLPDGEDVPNVYLNCSVKKIDAELWGTIAQCTRAMGGVYFEAFHIPTLKKKSDELLLDGNLTIVVDIEFDDFHMDESKSLVKEIKVQSLVNNISACFNNPSFSDITITCKDSRFYCHKVILSASSEVFAASFSQEDSAENQNNEVIIDDVKPEILKQLLEFLYTDKCIVVKETVGELLVAADKYSVIRLVRICQEFMRSKIGIGNFDLMLVQSYLQRDKQWQKITMDFILKNLNEVQLTSMWKVIKKEHPEIMAELVTFIMS